MVYYYQRKTKGFLTTYSIVGILAIIVSVIINFDLLFGKRGMPSKTSKVYLLFLASIGTFFVADTVWGFLRLSNQEDPFRVADNICLISMALSVFFWSLYAIMFLAKGRRNWFNRLFLGYVFAITVFGLVVIIHNFFQPTLFRIDAEGKYRIMPMHYILLTIQFIAFAVSSIYAFVESIITKDSKRYRYLAVGSFGIVMSVGFALQPFVIDLPLYSAASMIAICVFQIFVISKEKEELYFTKKLVRTDTLTGAGSRYAYVHEEERIDDQISKKAAEPFAVVVFDINELKGVNDTKGHDYGDAYIVKCYEMIRSMFACPIYRFGGDEFVTFLTGESYERREDLIRDFNDAMDLNLSIPGFPVVACGMAEYQPETDNSVRPVFMRADARMYARKQDMSSRKGRS